MGCLGSTVSCGHCTLPWGRIPESNRALTPDAANGIRVRLPSESVMKRVVNRALMCLI